MRTLLNNQKHRKIFLQGAFISVLAVILIAAITTAQSNMEKQGMVGSFDFLEQSTGWDVAFSLLPYSIHDSYSKVLLIGMINTIFLGSLSLIGATIVGGIIAVARISNNKLLRILGTAYVEIFRNVPLILQALFWYSIYTHLPRAKQALSISDSVFLSNRGLYFPEINVSLFGSVLAFSLLIIFIFISIKFMKGRFLEDWGWRSKQWVARSIRLAGFAGLFIILYLSRLPETSFITLPVLKGLNFQGGTRISPEFFAAFTAIVLFGASYIAEIFRAGLISVKAGVVEAGYALGLKPGNVLWHIHFPLALRSILPTLTNQYVWLLKATTVGIAIGFSDFFMMIAISINQSGQTLQLIGILIGGFLVLNLSLSTVLNWINRSIKIRGTQNR